MKDTRIKIRADKYGSDATPKTNKRSSLPCRAVQPVIATANSRRKTVQKGKAIVAYIITCTKFIEDTYNDFTEYDNYEDYFDDDVDIDNDEEETGSYQPLTSNPVIVFTEQDRKKIFLEMWLNLIYKPKNTDLTAKELLALLDNSIEGEQKINQFLTQMNEKPNFYFYYLSDNGKLANFKNRWQVESNGNTLPEHGEIVDIGKVVCAYCDAAWGEQYNGFYHYIKGVTVAELPITTETIKEGKPICEKNTNDWNKPVNFGHTFPEARNFE